MARLESSYWSYVNGVFSISTIEGTNGLPRIDNNCIRFRMNQIELRELAESIELLLKNK